MTDELSRGLLNWPQVAARPALVDLVQRAAAIGKIVFDKHRIDPFHIDVDTVILAVQIQFGKVTARCRDVQISKNPRNQLFTEQASELHAVIECNALQSEKSAAFLELGELDEKTALVSLART
ncbi:MAG: hypothetical protein IIA70_08110 [Proteobacteria bacterium]|nr:hypothetical protein [Pseudomonadota bacterium]